MNQNNQVCHTETEKMKRRNKKKTKHDTSKYFDHGTKIRRERGEVEVQENNIARVRKKTILRYHFDLGSLQRKHENEFTGVIRYEAGCKLQRDHAIAFKNQSILAMISEVRGQNYSPLDQKSAEDRYHHVMRYLKATNRHEAAYRILIADESLITVPLSMVDFCHILDLIDVKYCRLEEEERIRRRKMWDEAHENFVAVKAKEIKG